MPFIIICFGRLMLFIVGCLSVCQTQIQGYKCFQLITQFISDIGKYFGMWVSQNDLFFGYLVIKRQSSVRKTSSEKLIIYKQFLNLKNDTMKRMDPSIIQQFQDN